MRIIPVPQFQVDIMERRVLHNTAVRRLQVCADDAHRPLCIAATVTVFLILARSFGRGAHSFVAQITHDSCTARAQAFFRKMLQRLKAAVDRFGAAMVLVGVRRNAANRIEVRQAEHLC
jgi:hypothetical protein